MSSTSTSVVTAQGVRDGDRGALTALVERRGAAVLAYCEAVAQPGRGLEAAGEAFARFRREVRAAPEPRTLDPEALLLSATRHAAAAQAPEPAAPRGLLARRLGTTCPLVPELLVVRAEGELTAADRMRLGRHLERCEGCREAEQRFDAGERGYHDAPDEPPAPQAAGGLLAALRAAAPNADERRAPLAAEREAPGEEVPGADPQGPPADELDDDEPGLEREAPVSGPVAPAPPTGNGSRASGPPTLSWDPADVAAASAAEPPPRNWRRIAARIGVPALVLAAAVVTALAVAGAFSGGDQDRAGSVETDSAVPAPPVRVLQRPTTTPLPEGASGESAEPPRTTAAAASTSLAAAEPAQQPVAAPPVQSAPARAPATTPTPTATPRRSRSADDGRDAHATGGADAPEHNTGGQPAPGSQPQP